PRFWTDNIDASFGSKLNLIPTAISFAVNTPLYLHSNRACLNSLGQDSFNLFIVFCIYLSSGANSFQFFLNHSWFWESLAHLYYSWTMIWRTIALPVVLQACSHFAFTSCGLWQVESSICNPRNFSGHLS